MKNWDQNTTLLGRPGTTDTVTPNPRLMTSISASSTSVMRTRMVLRWSAARQGKGRPAPIKTLSSRTVSLQAAKGRELEESVVSKEMYTH